MEQDLNKNHRKTLQNDYYDLNKSPSSVTRRGKTGSEGGEAWERLNCGIEKVQSLLDENRVLIRQVNENHMSRIPDNLAKNVALIREINGNIKKVVSIYGDISGSFSKVVRHRKGVSSGGNAKVYDYGGSGSGSTTVER